MYRIDDQAKGLRGARNEDQSPILKRNGAGSGAFSIAVTSGKGGVGKTQISCNLAVALHQKGLRVLVLDADLGLASQDLALGVQPKADLRSVLNGECDISEILLETPVGPTLIPACPGRYEMANLGPRERNKLMNEVDRVAKDFDVLIIDTGAGIGSNAVDLAASADEVLLIATPDPTSLRDAYAMAKVLHRRSGLDRVYLVANQVTSDAEGATLHDRINSIVRRFLTLDLSYLGSIPRDENVRKSVSAGEPFVLRTPESLASRAIQGLVRRLAPETSQRELC